MPPPDLECWFCGGYLPRRLRVGGIHLLCSHSYDEWIEYPMNANIPNATVTAVHIHKPSGIRTVEIKCPHCPRAHTHGWPLDDPEGTPIGHRNAHCSDGNENRGYYIVQAQEIPA